MHSIYPLATTVYAHPLPRAIEPLQPRRALADPIA